MDTSFNILNCFDDSIDNLDITKYYIYVLQLVDNRYYVGRTGNILRRIEEHFTGVGSVYTIKYTPIKVIEVTEELSNQDERNKTLEIMSKYGWEKVRGACWCSLKICKPKENYKRKKIIDYHIVDLNDIDFEIIKLYNCDNKNIEEIGYLVKKSPCCIANRLEKLKIVQRKQLSRGYIQYIESDLYKLQYKKTNDARRENQSNNIVCNKTELTKEHLLNIKNIIREKFLNRK